MRVGSKTDIGRIRKHNEDSLLDKEPLFVVADGMGGHEAGEVASEIAISTFSTLDLQDCDANSLQKCVVEANSQIFNAVAEGKGKPGMGTTITAAIIKNDRLLIAQVGDSRCYLLTDGRLSQLTKDHSLMTEMIESNQISPEEARTHPNRSIITRALGSSPETQADIYELTINPTDTLLLCSDGLSGMIEDYEIESILNFYNDPQEAADALVNAANDFGGHDNITVIVVKPDDDSDSNNTSEKAKGKSLKKGIIAFAIVFILLVAAACGGFYYYAQNSAYLIIERNEIVLYKGLMGDIAGINLSWEEDSVVFDKQSIIPSTLQRLEEGIQFSSMDEAREALNGFISPVSTDPSTTDPSTTSPSTTPTSSANTTTSQPKSLSVAQLLSYSMPPMSETPLVAHLATPSEAQSQELRQSSIKFMSTINFVIK